MMFEDALSMRVDWQFFRNQKIKNVYPIKKKNSYFADETGFHVKISTNENGSGSTHKVPEKNDSVSTTKGTSKSTGVRPQSEDSVDEGIS